VTAAWRLAAGLSRMHQSLHPEAGVPVVGGVAALGNDASHWESLRSTLDITPRHQFDVALRHVGALPSPAVPAYTALDARLGWKVSRKLELSLIGQNLLDPRHPEWGVPTNRAELQRAVFVRAIWQQ
jgi:iron complex outermembrane receptor protein